MTEERTTEYKILEAAREVFIKKGMAGARMQEIADKAGINKALLHYYYRSKDQLFTAAFQSILKTMLPRLFEVFKSELPLEVKIYQVADIYFNFLIVQPELPLFVISELQRDPDMLFKDMDVTDFFDITVIQTQLDEEARRGTIRPIGAGQFLLNLMSMMIFPFVARPIVQKVIGLEMDPYFALMEARKTEVPKFIMQALRP